MDQLEVLAILSVILAGLCGSFFYSFGLFAPDLKSVCNLSQSQINLIGAFIYVFGESFQLIIGFITRLPKWTERIIILSELGTVLCWFILALIIRFNVSYSVLAITLGLLGISLISMCAPIINVAIKDLQPEIFGPVWKVFVVLFAAGGVFVSIFYMYINQSTDNDTRSIKLQILFLSFSILNVPTLYIFWKWLYGKNRKEREFLLSSSPVPNSDETEDDLIGQSNKTQFWSEIKEKFYLILSSRILWITNFILFINFGTAVNFYNNSGSIALTLDASDQSSKIMFIIFSIAQLIGRLVQANFSSPTTPPSRSFISLIITSSVLLLCHFVAWQWNSMLLMYFLIAANAYVYGCLWCIAFDFPNTGKLLDAKFQRENGLDFVYLFGFLAQAPAWGPLLFDLLSGKLYDRYADSDHNCSGTRCYQDYFGYSSICLLLSVVLAIWLYYDTSKQREKQRAVNAVYE